MIKQVQVRLQGDADAVLAVLRLLPDGWVSNLGGKRNADGSVRAYGTVSVDVGGKHAKAARHEPAIPAALQGVLA